MRTRFRKSADSVRLSSTAEGRRIVCDGVDVFAVDGGKIARKDTHLDWPAIQEQLAETPPAAASTA